MSASPYIGAWSLIEIGGETSTAPFVVTVASTGTEPTITQEGSTRTFELSDVGGVMTPGSDPYVAFEALGQEFQDLLGSRSFQENGLWSRRCPELYRADRQRKARGYLWFRVFMVQQWYDRVVRQSPDAEGGA